MNERNVESDACRWTTHPAHPWCSDDCPTWLDSARACPCPPDGHSPPRPVVSGVELHCDDCQQPYGVWFADNEVWNFVMGGPDAKGDPGGMLCPRCFTVRAEVAYQQTAIWRLTLDNPTRVSPQTGADS